MIQRIQTVYLFLSAIVMGIFLALPVYTAEVGKLRIKFMELAPQDDTLTLVITIVSIALSLITIFMYNNRPLQIKLGWATVVSILAVAVIVLFKKPEAYSFTPWVGLQGLAILFVILAIRGIKKDEKLVRSTDRLR